MALSISSISSAVRARTSAASQRARDTISRTKQQISSRSVTPTRTTTPRPRRESQTKNIIKASPFKSIFGSGASVTSRISSPQTYGFGSVKTQPTSMIQKPSNIQKPKFDLSSSLTKTKQSVYSMVPKVTQKYEQAEAITEKYIPSITEIKQSGYDFGKKHQKFTSKVMPHIETGLGKFKGSVRIVDEAQIVSRAISAKTGKPHVSDNKRGLESSLTSIGTMSTGAYTTFESKPIKTTAHVAAEVGMAYGGGYIFGAGAKVASLGLARTAPLFLKASKVSKYVPTQKGKVITSSIIKATPQIIETGAGVGFTGVIAKDIVETEASERPEKIFHLALGLKGASAGYRAPLKLTDVWRTRFMKELPASRVMEPQVLSGKQEYPFIKKGESAPALIKRFETSKYNLPKEEVFTSGGVKVWHGTKASWKSSTMVPKGASRPGDIPGLYVAPSVSPRFTRAGTPKSEPSEPFTPKQLFENMFGKPEAVKPSVLRIELEGGIGRMPKDVRYSQSKASEFLMTKGEKGKAYLSRDVEVTIKGGGKHHVESEALITPGTVMKQSSARTLKGERGFYIKIGDRRVPIKEYDALMGKPKDIIPTEIVGSSLKSKRIKTPKKSIKEEEALTFEKLISSSETVSPIRYRRPYHDLFGIKSTKTSVPPTLASTRKAITSISKPEPSTLKISSMSSMSSMISTIPSSHKTTKSPKSRVLIPLSSEAISISESEAIIPTSSSSEYGSSSSSSHMIDSILESIPEPIRSSERMKSYPPMAPPPSIKIPKNQKKQTKKKSKYGWQQETKEYALGSLSQFIDTSKPTKKISKKKKQSNMLSIDESTFRF